MFYFFCEDFLVGLSAFFRTPLVDRTGLLNQVDSAVVASVVVVGNRWPSSVGPMSRRSELGLGPSNHSDAFEDTESPDELE